MMVTVGITYQSWRQDQTERDIDPYGVVFHTGRWYVVGHDRLRADLRTFRIDRIASVTPARRTSPPPTASTPSPTSLRPSLRGPTAGRSR